MMTQWFLLEEFGYEAHTGVLISENYTLLNVDAGQQNLIIQFLVCCIFDGHNRY